MVEIQKVILSPGQQYTNQFGELVVIPQAEKFQYRTRIWITRETDRDLISEVPVEGATLGWSEWKDVTVSGKPE